MWLSTDVWWKVFELSEWPICLTNVCVCWRETYFARRWIAEAIPTLFAQDSFAVAVWRRPQDWDQLDSLPRPARSSVAHALAKALSKLPAPLPDAPDPTTLLVRLLPISTDLKQEFFEIPAYPRFQWRYVRTYGVPPVYTRKADPIYAERVVSRCCEALANGKFDFARDISAVRPGPVLRRLVDTTFWERDDDCRLIVALFEHPDFDDGFLQLLESYVVFVTRCLEGPWKSVPLKPRIAIRNHLRRKKCPFYNYPTDLRQFLVLGWFEKTLPHRKVFSVLIEDVATVGIEDFAYDLLANLASRNESFEGFHFRSLFNAFPDAASVAVDMATELKRWNFEQLLKVYAELPSHLEKSEPRTRPNKHRRSRSNKRPQ